MNYLPASYSYGNPGTECKPWQLLCQYKAAQGRVADAQAGLDDTASNWDAAVTKIPFGAWVALSVVFVGAVGRMIWTKQRQ